MKILAVSSLAVILFAGALFGFKKSEVQPPVESKIKWMTFTEAIEASKKVPRKLFVDVYTDWCGWCKRMDAATFENEIIATYVNEHYYAVKFNAEQKEDIVLGDKTYKFVESGRRGYHELASALLQGRMSYPTVVFLDEKINLIQPLPGYREAPEMDKILRFFGDDWHLTITYEDFLEQKYKSPFPAEEGNQ